MKYFAHRSGKFCLGEKTCLMGIVNITPDSFSDGGRYFSAEAAVDHALALIEDGADIVDLGACSTKPFSDPVLPEEEQRRLLPALTGLKNKTSVPVSIDSFYPSTVKAALENGADIINDVSGVFNPEAARLAARYGAGYIVMHGGTGLAPAQTAAVYPNGIINAVQSFFDEILPKLENAGVKAENICLDPGFGFMKDTRQNAELLKGLPQINAHGSAVLVGLSRKRFIGELSGAPDPRDRLGGTLAANVLAAASGADIIRTHEIKMHKQAIRLLEKMLKL